MATWWTFDIDGDAWYPAADSQGIEDAFIKGEATFDDVNYKFLLPLMLAVKSDSSAYVVRRPTDNDTANAWQFEYTYGSFVPISARSAAISRRIVASAVQTSALAARNCAGLSDSYP